MKSLSVATKIKYVEMFTMAAEGLYKENYRIILKDIKRSE